MRKTKQNEPDGDNQAVPAPAPNDPVEVEALGLISFDGDPETEGSEYYAPAGWEPEEPGDEASWSDAEGKSLRGRPARFVTTRIQAEALVKAGAVRIVG
jgi:hypothetical protein